jgi:ABC-type glycerol-3-phosphate transport system substrate-binding protein
MNRYFDAFKRAYNIDVSYKLVSNEYAQQLRLDMAANDLPDIFIAPTLTDLYELAEAGVIQDLSGLNKAFGVDSKRYYSWKKQLKQTGSLEKRTPQERSGKINKISHTIF